jgi:hypothetical protein
MPTPPFEDDRDFSENSEQRVQRIVTRARRRVAVRDLIAFGAGKVWLAAVAVGEHFARPRGSREEAP